MSREAMQMALEALEDSNDVARMEFGDENYYGEAIAVLRQALLQLHVNRVIKKEPTAFQCQCGKAYTVTCISSKPPKREWVGLTALEIYECWKTGDVVDAVEAKLKEKNT